MRDAEALMEMQKQHSKMTGDSTAFTYNVDRVRTQATSTAIRSAGIKYDKLKAKLLVFIARRSENRRDGHATEPKQRRRRRWGGTGSRRSNGETTPQSHTNSSSRDVSERLLVIAAVAAVA